MIIDISKAAHEQSDQHKWDKMRTELGKLTVKELKQIARDEGIILGGAASRKADIIAQIICDRHMSEKYGKAGKKIG